MTALASAVLVALFCFLWAAIEWFGSAAKLPPQQIVWLRYATHLLVLVGCCGWRYRASIIKTDRPWMHLVRSSLMFGMPLCFLAAVERMGLHTTMAAFWVAPLLLFVADRRAAAAPRNWIAALAGFGGALLLLDPTGSVSLGGLVFSAGMAVCFSGYLALTRRLYRELEVTNLFYTAFWVLIAMSFQLPRIWQTPSAQGLGVAAAIGVVGLLALYALDVAIKHTPPATIAAAFYLQPVFAALFQRAASRMAMAGMVLICGAVALQLAPAFSSTRSGAST